MQPQYIPLSVIFGPEGRYTVPLFQRPYVWNRTGQWEPLWDDVSALADRIITAQKGETPAGHFLGTAVLEQSDSQTGSLATREIIDGQQRLTTLQILLKAANHALEQKLVNIPADDEGSRKAFGVAARAVSGLTANRAYFDENEKYKVWPTNQDRPAFKAVMDAESITTAPRSGTRMAEAYDFFLGQVDAWLGDQPVAGRASALASALKDHLKLIVLDLDDNDEAQAIFETLNAHGTPLLPADLIKNWLIWEGTRQSLDAGTLYTTWWQMFDLDTPYWRAIVGTGHAARARIDTFLQNWLTRRTMTAVQPKHLYDRFLRHVGARPLGAGLRIASVDVLMEDINSDARRFRDIDVVTGTTRFHIFLRRLKYFDFIVFQPFLMGLLGRPGSDSADLDAIAVVFESWILRRMICRQQTRGYGAFALTLLEALASISPNDAAAPAVIAALCEKEGLTFPDDQTFERAWMSTQFYGYFRRERVLMILKAIEQEYLTSSKLSEPIISFNFDALQVEHIMPQTWDTNWPLPAGGDRATRDQRVHGIGNLTLVSHKLNPSLSNAAWLDSVSESGRDVRGKRSALNDHSNLSLNKRLVEGSPDRWDEEAMKERALALFQVAKKIWPFSQVTSSVLETLN
jgi:hypothetical protein